MKEPVRREAKKSRALSHSADRSRADAGAERRTPTRTHFGASRAGERSDHPESSRSERLRHDTLRRKPGRARCFDREVLCRDGDARHTDRLPDAHAVAIPRDLSRARRACSRTVARLSSLLGSGSRPSVPARVKRLTDTNDHCGVSLMPVYNKENSLGRVHGNHHRHRWVHRRRFGAGFRRHQRRSASPQRARVATAVPAVNLCRAM